MNGLEGELRGLAETLENLARETRRVKGRRDTRIRRAVLQEGHQQDVVARWAGVTRARVAQIAGARRPRAPRPAPVEPVERPAPVEPAAVPGLAVTAGSTRRAARWGELRPVFLDVTPRLTLADVLAAGEGAAVYLCGPRPGTGDAAGMRAWLLACPDGWRVVSAWISDASTPVVRYEHTGGARVSVYRAAAWFGEGTYPAASAEGAWHALDALLRASFGSGAGMRATPTTTGRDLWTRTIPHGREWPVQHPELRALIAATSGQGRVELLPPASPTVPRLVQYDARLAYAALVWGLPVGAPAWHERPTPDEWRQLVQRRGRWLVGVRVPHEWRHVGLLPCRDVGASWCWPREPGAVFRTWVDADEARLAIRHGWLVTPERGVTWAEGKPLTVWRDRLTAGYLDASPLVAAGIRSIILHTLGGFAQRAHPTTHAVSRPEDVPAGARDVTQPARGVYVYTVDTEPGPEALPYAHPEWAAAVWARARCRLLEAPAQDGQLVGALHVPFADVIALRTDALYLARDPRWPDTGKLGAYRLKNNQRGPVPWPLSADELLEV